MKPNLKIVQDEPPKEPPAPDLSYEFRDRQRIASRNWERVHISGDKRQPIELGDRKGGWR